MSRPNTARPDDPQWKHGSYYCPPRGSSAQADAVAIFDDEPGFPDQDVIYYRYGNKFSPCRSVCRDTPDSPTHWHDVLTAWGSHHPLEDHRQDRSTPLPVSLATP